MWAMGFGRTFEMIFPCFDIFILQKKKLWYITFQNSGDNLMYDHHSFSNLFSALFEFYHLEYLYITFRT